MARKGSVLISVDLPLDPAQVDAICGSVPGDQTRSQKVAEVALGLLEQLCEGALVVPAVMVRKMHECLGRPPELPDIIDQFERGTGRKDGQLSITVPIDPVIEPVLRDAAQFNGYQSVEQYYRSLLDTANDQGWFHQIQPNPARVLMTQKAHDELSDILGKKFDNGTELAAMVKEYVTDNSGIFSGKD